MPTDLAENVEKKCEDLGKGNGQYVGNQTIWMEINFKLCEKLQDLVEEPMMIAIGSCIDGIDQTF